MIYLDNAATTQPSTKVIRAMAECMEQQWHNPSSGYTASNEVTKQIQEARAKVAALIDASPDEIYFTSGGTESNNTALTSVHTMLPEDAVMATSQIEHSATLRPMELIAKSGRKVEYLPVDVGGRVIVPKSFSVAFLSVMSANNETGIRQPIDVLSTLSQEQGVAFHTDAVQLIGKERFSVKQTPVDMLSISGHKFNGPKGVGALYVRSGFRFAPLLHGGGQESGKRSGTENVPGIIGMGVAAEEAYQRDCSQRVAEMRDAFEKKVLETVQGSEVNGDVNHRLPSHSHLSFDGCEAEGLVILLDEYGLQCSSGSACMTGKQQPSHVQLAMGFSEKKAKSSLRLSFSHLNTMEEAEKAAELVEKAVTKLRSVQNNSTGPVVVYTP